VIPIQYSLIAKAIEFYHLNGYSYIEAPWVVSKDALSATLPPNKFGYGLYHPNQPLNYLVGSAEQSLIQMMLNGDLKYGDKICAAGPCFRDDIIDEFHFPYFFKVELMEINGDENSVHRIMRTVKGFIDIINGPLVNTLKTEDGFDLTVNGVEIGSYGIRTFKGYTWAYGTGLALPRYSQLSRKN